MGKLSPDNCMRTIRVHNMCDNNWLIDVIFEKYGLSLTYEGPKRAFIKEFETIFKAFCEAVLKSYKEYIDPLPTYEECFDAMIEDFETVDCPFCHYSGKVLIPKNNTKQEVLLERI